jgi:flagellar biosynthesis/type III secretory pathway chaperone
MASMKETAARVRRLTQLEDRVAELEAEVQECRQVNLRLAELTDVVAELLLPVAQRDEARIDEVLRRYHDSVGVPPS